MHIALRYFQHGMHVSAGIVLAGTLFHWHILLLHLSPTPRVAITVARSVAVGPGAVASGIITPNGLFFKNGGVGAHRAVLHLLGGQFWRICVRALGMHWYRFDFHLLLFSSHSILDSLTLAN